MSTHTIYEFPLNERIRVFMRLEQLFKQLEHFMRGSSVYDKRAAISVLLDILMIFNRNDLKSEALKELDRHAKRLKQIASSQNVDSTKLDSILQRVNGISKALYQANGKIAINLMESDLFKSISQRSSIPGGMCSFDLPEFHYWLEQDVSSQQQDLDEWTKPLIDIRSAIKLILNFVRQSSNPSEEIASAGFFQATLELSRPFQLLRVTVDQTLPCFAEISGGKHRFTVRFMKKSSGNKRASQVNEDVPFMLTQCVF